MPIWLQLVNWPWTFTIGWTRTASSDNLSRLGSWNLLSGLTVSFSFWLDTWLSSRPSFETLILFFLDSTSEILEKTEAAVHLWWLFPSQAPVWYPRQQQDLRLRLNPRLFYCSSLLVESTATTSPSPEWQLSGPVSLAFWLSGFSSSTAPS